MEGRIRSSASIRKTLQLDASTVSESRHAVVAGAGVAGLSTAIALSRAGWRVTVLERAPLVEDVGAGLQIPPNAAAILRGWGALDKLEGKSLAPEALRLRRAGDGRDVIRMPLGALAELRWGAPYLVAHRADLIAALLQQTAREASVLVETGVDVVGFARSENGVQVAVRQEGQAGRRDGDLLIGADGLRSLVRHRLGLGLTDEPIWSGRTAWRALVDARRAPAHALRLETCLWLGSRAHLVHYPLRGGDLVNLVAVIDDDWRGQEGGDLWSARGDSTRLRPFFTRWHRDARDLVEAVDDWRRWPLFDRDLASRWTDARVALVGDAAHPMVPFLAQGAAQAVEDAQALGRALSSDLPVPRALAKYEAERMPRAAAVQLASRRQGAIYHLTGPAALARDAVLNGMGFERMMRRLDWLYQGGA
jgi:salicylate hydroxylase